MDEWPREALFTLGSDRDGRQETVQQSVMAGMGVSRLSRHSLRLELLHGKMAILPIDGTPVLRGWPNRLAPVARFGGARGSEPAEVGALQADGYGPARPAKA